mgnify:CR=1 FL=1
MKTMIKKVAKELVDFKLATKANRNNCWTNIKIEVNGANKRALIKDEVVHYIPNTKEYDFIDELVAPKGIIRNSYVYDVIKSAEASEPITDEIKEVKTAKCSFITSEAFTVNGDKFCYDVKSLKNFPKKNITYNKVVVEGAPMLVIKQDQAILGLLLPIKMSW